MPAIHTLRLLHALSRPTRLGGLGICTLALGLSGPAIAQTAAPPPVASSSVPDAPSPQAGNAAGNNVQASVQDRKAVNIRNTPRHFLSDQKAIWTSPAQIRVHDLEWMLPLAAATGAGIATDHHAMASVVSRNPSFNQANVNASNVLIGGFIAAPVAIYGFGHFEQDEHARETGILGGEALLDGVVVEEITKVIFRRERPMYDNAHGLFFNKNAHLDSSFPSSHSVLAWSAASVLAEEYPSRWTRVGVYSLATGVCLTRVMGQEHFPSDVLVGSALGWLVGHYVYRVHHRHQVIQIP